MKTSETLQRIAEAIESLVDETKASTQALQTLAEEVKEIRQELRGVDRRKTPALSPGVRTKPLIFAPNAAEDSFCEYLASKGVELSQGAAVKTALTTFIKQTFEDVKDDEGALKILESHRTNLDGHPESFSFDRDFARWFVDWRKEDERTRAREQDEKYRSKTNAQ